MTSLCLKRYMVQDDELQYKRFKSMIGTHSPLKSQSRLHSLKRPISDCSNDGLVRSKKRCPETPENDAIFAIPSRSSAPNNQKPFLAKIETPVPSALEETLPDELDCIHNELVSSSSLYASRIQSSSSGSNTRSNTFMFSQQDVLRIFQEIHRSRQEADHFFHSYISWSSVMSGPNGQPASERSLHHSTGFLLFNMN